MLRPASILAMCLTSGCLAADPPIYEQPEQIVPQIRTALVDPPILAVLQLDRDVTRTFTVPFSSEDLGDRIRFALHADYRLEGEDFLQEGFVLPGSIDDAGRQVATPWAPDSRMTSGCHTLTMIITHESNFDFVTRLPIDDARAAFVTWWVNVDPDETDPQTLKDCPLPGPLAGSGSG